MTIEAELADGRILEFPDGTDPAVIQSTVKRIVGGGAPASPVAGAGGAAPSAVATPGGASAAGVPTSRDILAGQLQQGRETLSQENIGQVLGLAAPAGLAGAAAGALRSAPFAARAAGVGAATGAGDIGQQAGEAIRGEREGIDPAQAALATGLGGAGQAAGEAIGALAPAAIRGIFRGGEAGRRGVQEAITDAARVGGTPTVAQATQSTFLDSIEQLLAKAPGGAGRIRQRVQSTTQNVREGLERLSSVGGRGLDAESGGRAAIRGVEDFVERFQARSGPLFDEITARVGATSPAGITNTQRALNEITTPIAGAERTSERFVSPFIKGLADDIAADAGAGGQLPFQALQRVRSLVGEKLANPSLTSDVPNAQLKRLYGAISDDIRSTAQAAGPEAARAFSRANRFYRAGQGRIQDTLEPLVRNRVPEQVFESLLRGGKTGGTQLRTVMRSLRPEQQDAITGTVIRRLGTAVPSQQGAEGAEFSFNTFLTKWNQLDEGARNALFNRGRNLSLGNDLNALARFAERVRESSKAFANPSGTSGSTIGSAMGLASAGSLIASPVLGTGALALPLIFGGGAGAANLGARLMTSRSFVRWLAQATRTNPQGIPAQIGRLEAIAAKEDPETRQAILGYLEQIQQ